MRLILASASPRRAELLTSAGYAFDIIPAEVDEAALPGEHPDLYVVRVAQAKARHVAAACEGKGVVLAADTVVVAGGRMMGKPVDAQDAAAMLAQLSGAVHAVLTAIVLRSGGEEVSDLVRTKVQFARLSDDEVSWYIASGEPFGKAGAYAIQGRAARFIDWIEGSWSNVVGLPVASVHRLLSTLADRV